MGVRVELLASNVWASEDDKTDFLNFGGDIFESIIFERTTNILDRGANEYYKLKIWSISIIDKSERIKIGFFNEWSKINLG